MFNNLKLPEDRIHALLYVYTTYLKKLRSSLSDIATIRLILTYLSGDCPGCCVRK